MDSKSKLYLAFIAIISVTWFFQGIVRGYQLNHSFKSYLSNNNVTIEHADLESWKKSEPDLIPSILQFLVNPFRSVSKVNYSKNNFTTWFSAFHFGGGDWEIKYMNENGSYGQKVKL